MIAYLVEVHNRADFCRVVCRIVCLDQSRAHTVGYAEAERRNEQSTDPYDRYDYNVIEVETDQCIPT